MLTKICGITDKAALRAAVQGNASMLGLVFYPPSPRYLTIAAAENLLRHEDVAATKIVALTVNAAPMMLDSIISMVKPHILQMHGDESPIFCMEARENYRLPVIKAISIRRKEDLELAESYYGHVDYLLLDAPAKDTEEYGGTGTTFDWRLLRNWKCPVPWILAGGLNEKNVCDAMKRTNPYGVDVSSGVEIERGKKSPQKITSFLKKVEECVTH